MFAELKGATGYFKGVYRPLFFVQIMFKKIILTRPKQHQIIIFFTEQRIYINYLKT